MAMATAQRTVEAMSDERWRGVVEREKASEGE